MAKDNRSIGQFKLEGIAPAPRNIPQIEVTFDIDANGILTVSAQDKATGKQQTVTISGSSNLDRQDIDRMIREAEVHSNEDKKRREDAEVRNQADALVYSVERQLRESAGKLQVHEEGRIRQLLDELKQTLKESGNAETIRTLQSDLLQAASAFQSRREDAQTSGFTAGPPPNDDAIDVEYTENP
jgi:molecular chaperone DnaK